MKEHESAFIIKLHGFVLKQKRDAFISVHKSKIPLFVVHYLWKSVELGDSEANGKFLNIMFCDTLLISQFIACLRNKVVPTQFTTFK